MNKKYILKNKNDNSEITMTIDEILNEINRDRSDEWTNYNENDWKEGSEVFTEYEIVGVKLNFSELDNLFD